ncbi:unnamed protein product [Gongylonema pulchrum]|uniref:Uncharacterized protein n=1 Tax=Gongylonema pulchrum TaxID=637853 RepID=A0A183E193_9BILA|nr:unnamed protein product [Gongylonema pulchrum]
MEQAGDAADGTEGHNEVLLGGDAACEPSTSAAGKEAHLATNHNGQQMTVFKDAHPWEATAGQLFGSSEKPPGSPSSTTAPPVRKLAVASKVPAKRLLCGAKSDAALFPSPAPHYTRSLSKSDLMELKRSIVKSDFKPVQDPLSAPKLTKNHSFDCHPWHHSPVFGIGVSESNRTSRCGCESVLDSEESDHSRPSVLFPSVR